MPDPSPQSSRGDLVVVVGLFLVALLAYGSTAAPGIVAEGDSGEFVAAARVGGIPHAPGYPTYMLLASALGCLVPAAQLARALNLMSAVCGALAVALLAWLALRLARRALPAASSWCVRGCAVLAALLLGGATEFWNQALGAEVYTLGTLLLVACLERMSARATPGGWSGAALAAGLALGVHYNVGLPCVLLVAAGAWMKRSALGTQGLLRMACAFCLGCATFLYLPLRSLADPVLDLGDPETPVGLWRTLTLADMPTGKSIGRAPGVLAAQVAAVAGLARQQWPAWVFALVAVGALACAARRGLRRAAAACAAVVVLDYAGILLMSNFALVDEEIYELRFLFLPAYAALALLGGLGCAGLLELLERRARGLAPLGLALLALALAPHLSGQRRTLDKRDDHVMHEYGLALLAAAEGPAVLFTYGDNAWMPLTYLQVVEGLRPDVTVVAAGLLRHAWYRRALVARDSALVLRDEAPGVVGLARANVARAHLYHADPRARDLQGFQEVPSGLLRRIVPAGVSLRPVVPPAPSFSPHYAPRDRRERSIRADAANAYLRTARWCRENGHAGEALEALDQGLRIALPAPRMEEFHLVRAALRLERGDLLAAQGRRAEARAEWQDAFDEAPASPPAELARNRLDAAVSERP